MKLSQIRKSVVESVIAKNDWKGPYEALMKAIRDYQENPTVGDHEKVDKIVSMLSDDHPVTKKSREILGSGDVTIFRGSYVVDSNANAGWSTDPDVAIRFAMYIDEGEVCKATVPVEDVLFYDRAMKDAMAWVEDEVILKKNPRIKIVGCADVEEDDVEYMSHHGYPSEDSVERIMKKLGVQT